MVKENSTAFLGSSPKAYFGVDLNTPNLKKPTRAYEDPDVLQNVSPWGNLNTFPTVADDEIKKCTPLAYALAMKVQMLSAMGLEYGYEEDGKFVPKYDSDFEKMLFDDNTQYYIRQAIYDYVRYGNFFPELIFSPDKSKVIAVSAQLAKDTRWGLMTPEKPFIAKAFISKNWEDGDLDDDKNTIPMSVIDPLLDTIQTIKEKNKTILKYIFRASLFGSNNYYQVPNWWVLKESGDLELWELYNKKKIAILKNEMTPKYVIDVHPDWVAAYLGDKWDKADADGKKELFKGVQTQISEMLHGSDNAGKDVFVSLYYDARVNELVPGWKFSPVPTDSLSDKHIEDIATVENRIISAVGLHNTILGSKTGKGHGAGSGSDIREAFNTDAATNGIHYAQILQPLMWAAKYNGYDEKIKIRFKQGYLQTLDKTTPDNRTLNTTNA